MPISFDSALGIHEQALMLREQRTEVLARNLANSDTPGYKARDIDFRAALQQETQGGGGALSLTTTSPGHIPTTGGAGAADLLYRVPTQPSADGNTVEGQVEQAQFGENAVRYQASLTFLGDAFKGLVAAIRGQ